MKKLARVIAFYLPQFHPIPENDKWWGKGFTEWTNVVKAKPMFKGHYQPHIPGGLGFYDLRVPETRIAQAEMAKEFGIDAFCYYHYWFAGRRILERPFNEVLESGKPDFPFCICWANETWTGVWHGTPNKILIEQTYPGEDDYVSHFNYLLKAFLDRRYVTIGGKPLFIIYRPWLIPKVEILTDCWKRMAIKAGLPGLFLIGGQPPVERNASTYGFDGFINSRFPELRENIWVSRRKPIKWAKKKVKDYLYRNKPTIYSYEKVLDNLLHNDGRHMTLFPCVIPNWDNTPRSGSNGLVLHGSRPELFRKQLKKALEITKDISRDNNIIFIKAWNEWAEGNHLEPDLKFGMGYLKVIKEEIFTNNKI